ncbi:MAG TPA: branched-chain amino acid ABC transporter permease [Mycobacteriales bacterium]|nr:branched-chain amino acid ABC transporter permease [Mycobacteriales bacterium]
MATLAGRRPVPRRPAVHRRWRLALRLAVAVAVLAVVLALPHTTDGGLLFVWETAAVQVLFATSVNLLFGEAGIPSFGQAAFFGVGAYTVALGVGHGWSPPLLLLAAIGCAGLAAGLTGLLTWRTTGLAFAMLTLAVAQACYTLVIRTDAFGGFNGIPSVTIEPVAGLRLDDPTVFWYFLAGCVGLGVLAFWRISRSPFGHTLRSIRQDEVRAAFLGVNVRAYRVLAFTLAGCGAGLAGALFGYANQIVTPDAMFWTGSATPIIMLLLGGMGYFLGPAAGAVLFTWLLHYLNEITTSFLFVTGLLLLAVLIFLPRGLLSLPATAADLAARLARRRARRRAWSGPGPEPAPRVADE